MATQIDELPAGQKVQRAADDTMQADNVGIGAGSIGTNGVNVLFVGNGTAPTSYPADEAQAWSADISAGNAAWRWAGEGAVAGVMVGGLNILQKTGTPGTDELRITHDGTNASLVNASGGNAVLINATGQIVTNGPDDGTTADIAVGGSTAHGFLYYSPTPAIAFNLNSAGIMAFIAGGVSVPNNLQYLFSSTASTVGTADVGIERLAAGVMASTNGSTGTGWFQNSAGEAALESDYTRADATMTSTALSVALLAGRSYRIECCLKIANSTAADGIKVDFNGGTATITTFFAGASFIGSVTAGVVVSEALDTDLTATVVTGTDMMIITGYIEVDGAGTFILRAAEVVDGGGTLTVGAGSWMALYDTVDK